MTRVAARLCCLAAVLILFADRASAADPDPLRVNPPGQKPDDIRLKPQRTLNDKYHPWSPPESKAAWEKEAERIRRQLLVSNGLWPLPEKQPLQPEYHGVVDRGDYTVEGVSFASRPGVYVTGSLYRPKKGTEGKHPGVLCPHGHWLNGRFYDAGEKAALEQLKTGAETFLSGAHSPLQARMVQLARMGCTVFFYDMVGTADNTALPHREGFNDVAAELWLQNKMGLQTWNSIRAVDFITSLPEVDPDRIGVTGASGGGTQTFMLMALDPRPAVAFPAVMVGTAMQGGCQCENASYLRVGINNVAIAALTAPRPLGMSGANDWTIDIETKGLPELKKVYGFYGKEENVWASCRPEFPHNYNEVSREMMYAWMAKHLGLKDAPVEQLDFWPMTRDQLTIFNDKYPTPKDWLNAEQLRALMTKESQELMAKIAPTTAADAERYRQVVGGALEVMLGPPRPKGSMHDFGTNRTTAYVNVDRVAKMTVDAGGRRIPVVTLDPDKNPKNEIVCILSDQGKSSLFDDSRHLRTEVTSLLKAGYCVASADLFLTGEYLADGEQAKYAINAGFPGYTLCYNAPLITHRVQDILAVVEALETSDSNRRVVHLVGTKRAGLWSLLAATQKKGERIGRVIADLNGFRFTDVTTPEDPNLLPGALLYGDIDGLAALAADADVRIYGAKGDWPLFDAMKRVTNGKATRTPDNIRLDDLATALK